MVVLNRVQLIQKLQYTAVVVGPSLLNPNSRKNGTLIIKEPLRNQVSKRDPGAVRVEVQSPCSKGIGLGV